MSLDFYLEIPGKKTTKDSSGIFIREEGMTKEISLEEWNKRYPDREPVILTDDDEESEEVFHANITHNLGAMAKQAGIYECLWRPNELGVEKAGEIIGRLKCGIDLMESCPDVFKEFDAENGWGTYEQFLPWVKNVLKACEKYPDAEIDVWV